MSNMLNTIRSGGCTRSRHFDFTAVTVVRVVATFGNKILFCQLCWTTKHKYKRLVNYSSTNARHRSFDLCVFQRFHSALYCVDTGGLRIRIQRCIFVPEVRSLPNPQERKGWGGRGARRRAVSVDSKGHFAEGQHQRDTGEETDPPMVRDSSNVFCDN